MPGTRRANMPAKPNTIEEVHDAIVAALELPSPPTLTVAQDVAFRARLLDLIKNGSDDPVVAYGLFRDVMDGIDR